MSDTPAVDTAPHPPEEHADREDSIVIQILADLFSTGVLDTLTSIIEIVVWED